MDTKAADDVIEKLQGSKELWVELDINEKIRILDDLRTRTGANARRWVEAAVSAKGLSMDSPLAGEEWLGGPYAFIDTINTLKMTLERIEKGRDVLEGFKVSRRPDGQVLIDVLPFSASDRILFSGSSAQVWMDPEVELETLPERVGGFYRDDDRSGSLTLILGAGNVSSIPPLDVLYKLFNEGSVVLLKMNPVNDYLGEIFEELFGGLVEDGYAGFIYGGAEVGEYLTQHEGVDEIHITGSEETYNSIRFGEGSEGEERRISGTPINTRVITAELGGVTPTIIVPGNWSPSDLRFQAENIVTQKMNNSGFNCVATQVLILPESWSLTDALLDEIRSLFGSLEERDAYYPGAVGRCEAVGEGSGTVEVYGDESRRYIVTGIDSSEVEDPAFKKEYFAPVLAVLTLPSPDISSYVDAAVTFANDVLTGSLGANVIVHPKTEREYGDALDRMISGLKYGGIGINTWCASVYLLSRSPWGAFPGNTDTEIGSGVGVVHNTLMLSDTQKAVARAPFAQSHRTLTKGEIHMAPRPVFFVTNKEMHRVGERLVEFAVTNRVRDLVKVVSSALRG